MSRELPIFPLPLVLFPGSTQPLHIFEPRYRRLLADCLAGDRRFGVAYAAPDRPGLDPEPDPGDVGCVALIQDSQALPDGRANIVTVGERRFTILGWLASDRPYRMAQIEEFDDAPVEVAEAGQLAAGVRADFTRLSNALAVLTDRDDRDLALPDDPQDLSFRVAAELELEPEVKQALLAIRDTTARLRRLAAVLAPLAADAERGAAVRQRARGNGKGGAHPKIERTT
jgi:Lon protease-like protein